MLAQISRANAPQIRSIPLATYLCVLWLQVKHYRMFHDDSMRSFFRRLTFTPDGSFLLTPGAQTYTQTYTLTNCNSTGVCGGKYPVLSCHAGGGSNNLHPAFNISFFCLFVCFYPQRDVWRQEKTSQIPPISFPGRALRGDYYCGLRHI